MSTTTKCAITKTFILINNNHSSSSLASQWKCTLSTAALNTNGPFIVLSALTSSPAPAASSAAVGMRSFVNAGFAFFGFGGGIGMVGVGRMNGGVWVD